MTHRRFRITLVLAALIAWPAYAGADNADAGIDLGGYVQPGMKFRQNDDIAQNDENGFRVRRARIAFGAEKPGELVDVSAEIEAELTPEFRMLDAFVRASSKLPGDGAWLVDLGQAKAPISRSVLMSDALLQFVEKPAFAQGTGLAPERQIGARAYVRAPHAPCVSAWAGVFNGEGVNQPDNIDENFLFAGRLVVSPIGWDQPLQATLFDGPVLSFGGSAGYEESQLEFDIEQTYVGADVFGAWQGLAGTFELLWVDVNFEDDINNVDHNQLGWDAQLGYLLPIPGYLYRRFEIAGRVEELDRNDQVPIVRVGDPNQSLRRYTGGINYYHRGHAMKVQLNATHVTEVEDQLGSGDSATYDNDEILLQVTYILE